MHGCHSQLFIKIQNTWSLKRTKQITTFSKKMCVADIQLLALTTIDAISPAFIPLSIAPFNDAVAYQHIGINGGNV